MKKNNNNIVIILLGIIIVLLATLIILLATKTITWNTKTPATKTETKTTKEESKKEIDKTETQTETKEQYQITYEEEEYITKRNDGSEVSRSKRNLPKITNNKNQEAANKIVKSLTDISNQNWENNIKKMADQVVELPYNDLGVTYLYQTGIITTNRLTFTLKMDGGFGGVGWISEEGFNFDAKTGEMLTTENVAVNSTDFKNYMLKKVNEEIENIKNTRENCIRDDYQKNLEKEITNNGNWYFTSTEIKIKLQKYAIACGAGGMTEINLPKEEVNQYLKEEYKI